MITLLNTPLTRTSIIEQVRFVLKNSYKDDLKMFYKDLNECSWLAGNLTYQYSYSLIYEAILNIIENKFKQRDSA